MLKVQNCVQQRPPEPLATESPGEFILFFLDFINAQTGQTAAAGVGV